jgi:4-hydroxy 2-oxovalerate aldolase
MDEVKILDCTFRDGGHLLNWKFKQETVEKVIAKIQGSGIDYYELGYRFNKISNHDKDFGLLAYSDEEYLREIKNKTNIENITIMMDVGKTKKEDFIDSKNSMIDTVRVATYANTIDLALEHVDDLYEKGYEVFLNLMAYTHIDKQEIVQILNKIDKSKKKLKAFYFADSFGSLYPNSIKEIINVIKEHTDIKIGFHGHNNLQMAFANTLTAIENGVTFIDSSLYGQGRGAGNLPTEIICAYLDANSHKHFDMKKIISIIESTFIGCSSKVTWGYNIDTFLSGINDVHPSYIKKLRTINLSTVESYILMQEMAQNKNIFSGYNEVAFEELLKAKKIIE